MGSMTERTFRSPSPSPGRSPAPRERDVPPVPAMPSVDQIMASHHTNTNGQNKGPVLQTQPFRTASQKLKAKEGQQASWFGGATARESATPRTADAALHSENFAPDPRPGSVSPSINFSYPRVQSPDPSFDDQTLVFDANSRRMVPRSELVPRPQTIPELDEKPQKKKQAAITRAGSHLSKGTVGRTQAPALDVEAAYEAEPEPSPALENGPGTPQGGTPKKKKKKKKKKTVAAQTSSDIPLADETDVAAAEGDDDQVARPALVKKPSIVQEYPEQEEIEEQQHKAKQLQSSPTAGTVAAAETPKKKKKTKTKAMHSEQQAQQPQTPETKQNGSLRQTRLPSESPARSARFAASSAEQLVVKHEPLPRSVSPRKSALKLSSQARGVSPSDSGSPASSRGLSPYPDNEDPATARKKSVRVSWDDRNTVVVGEAAHTHATESPIIPSPQTKKPWHNVVSKFTRKEPVAVAEDEKMTPRPALPQFGSVREKKSKEPEERPLVRPLDRPRTDVNAASPDAGHATDVLVGAALAQDQAAKNAANISKTREPLPDVQPSIENDEGQNAAAQSSDDELFHTDVTTDPEDVPEPSASKQSDSEADNMVTPANHVAVSSSTGGGMPTISVSTPSPRADLSGAIADDSDDDDDSSASSTPTRTTQVDPIAVEAIPMTDIEEETETETEPFSDAREELDDVDGDGFLSLDAVVDSPTSKPSHKAVLDKALEASTGNGATSAAANASDDAGPPPDDWENAKAYWKSLSVDKRRQLEIEALSEAGDEPDADKPPTDAAVSNAAATDTTAPALATATVAATVAGTTASADHAATTSTDESQRVKNASETIEKQSVQSKHRSYQIQPGTKWTDAETSEDVAKRASVVAAQPQPASAPALPKLRQTMRQSMRTEDSRPPRESSSERTGGLRKSMRNGPPPVKSASATTSHPAGAPVARSASASVPTTATASVSMRKSLRGSRSNGDTLRPSLSAAGRPASYHSPATASSSVGHKRNMSTDDLSSGSRLRPTLRRRGSDESDSSFKRKRPGSRDGQSFRMTMRASAQESADPTKRFSLRSLSPPGFRRNSFSSLPPASPGSMGGGSGRMRQSLRDRPVSSSSRLKMGSFKKQSGRSSGGIFNKRGGSRFADSSDEDDGDGGLAAFRSRFVDSSDEEEPAPLPSLGKGMPKSLRNGSSHSVPERNVVSPDIPDRDGGVITQPKRNSINTDSTLRRNGSGRGTLTSLEPPRPAASTRRGSFMSTILRRKKDQSGKISKEVAESAARKDTSLERSPEELAGIRNGSLHKRGPSWPFPDGEGANGENGGPSAAVDKSRPSTSGGAAPSSRKSAFLRRRSASQGMVGLNHDDIDPNEPVPPLPTQAQLDQLEPGKPQIKKKKFGALRKMFGIHD